MSEQERSNTAGNSGKRGKPFAKGDARINRKGRPKTFDALRKEALKIAGEIVVNPKTGEEASVVHAILRSWASGDAQAQKTFIEYAYGKVPNKEEHSGPNGSAIAVNVSLLDDAIQKVYGDKDESSD